MTRFSFYFVAAIKNSVWPRGTDKTTYVLKYDIQV